MSSIAVIAAICALVLGVKPAAGGQRGVEHALKSRRRMADDLLGVREALRVLPERAHGRVDLLGAVRLVAQRARIIGATSRDAGQQPEQGPGNQPGDAGDRARLRRSPAASRAATTAITERSQQVAVAFDAAPLAHQLGNGPERQQPECRGVAADRRMVGLERDGQRHAAHAAEDEQGQHRERPVAALDPPTEDRDRQHRRELVPAVERRRTATSRRATSRWPPAGGRSARCRRPSRR